jgi:putative ATP-binding cassette transporter
MNLITIFSQKAPNRVFLSIVFGAAAGILYSFLIPLVLISIPKENGLAEEANNEIFTILSLEVSNYKIALLFIFVCVGILVMKSLSEIILNRVACEVTKDLRVKFYNHISSASIETLEKVGSSKLIASLNVDVPKIISGASALPALIINGITLIGMLSFLMYLNFDVFKLVIMSILVGVIIYQVPIIAAAKIFRRSRDVHDQLQESVKGLIYGAKELKLDQHKRNFYLSQILYHYENNILKNDKSAQTIMRATNNFGDLISFLVIGAVSFIFVNYYSISSKELIGVIMALLYITGPIGTLLDTIPTLTIASISFKKLSLLLNNIPKEKINLRVGSLEPWDEIIFDKVEYSYRSNSSEKGFHIGPISFRVKKGEVIFIVGANGSGKSTLSKLITLHYKTEYGNILFGNTKVDSNSIESLRQSVTAIYSDYYLFERLLREVTDDIKEKVLDYLEKFQLRDKVKLNEGSFSTLALSDGQRKRLALIISILEDKDVYLFDEWAADQDPDFKKVFYDEILPDLRAKDKIVLVISHDDRYFEQADRILVMEQGLLSESKQVT